MRFAAIRGNNETEYIGNSDTGHANVSNSQTSLLDMPRRKYNFII
jgi:hypothetical protein